jgi:hypothetical protein
MPAAASTAATTAVLDRPAPTATKPMEVDPELRDVIDRMKTGRRRAADAVRDPLPKTLNPERPTTTTAAETEADVEHGR